MTTTTLTRKIEQVEQRLRKLEHQLREPRVSQEDVHAGLELLHGIWASRPRSSQELKRVRRRIWSSHA
ncbi:hypothetical protein HYW17_03605 [Candidatus Uhrbacteria bacterium]|nr:hypothetical protein [Candidatus Uhrbacteria bacterium]